jgi:hypothetical protein
MKPASPTVVGDWSISKPRSDFSGSSVEAELDVKLEAKSIMYDMIFKFKDRY